MHVLYLIVARIATNCSIVSQICLFVRAKVALSTIQKIRTFHASLVSSFAVLINTMAKNFRVLRTSRGGVVMATIHLVMFGIVVYEYPQCGKHT